MTFSTNLCDMSSGKLVVIGFDGADRETLLNGMNSGNLSSLAELASEGSIATLLAPEPPITPVAMSSILTGNNPDRHGVFGFESKDGYVGYDSIEGKTLYDMLEDREVVSINVPMTSPLPPGDTMISGFPATSSGIARPFELEARLENEGYRVEPVDISAGREEFVEDVFDMQEKRIELGKDLLEQNWDLFFLMFTGDARLQHYIHDEDVIMEFYENADRFLGYLREKRDVEVMIVSDHGFSDLECEFDIGRWLQQEGYMEGDIESDWDYLYGKMGHDIDAEAYPGSAYRGGIYVNGSKEELREKLENVEYKGKKVFREILEPENGPDLLPVPRRGFNHVIGRDQVFNEEPEEKRTPDSEGVIMSSIELDTSDTPRSIDVLPTILSIMGMDGEGMDGQDLLI